MASAPCLHMRIKLRLETGGRSRRIYARFNSANGPRSTAYPTMSAAAWNRRDDDRVGTLAEVCAHYGSSWPAPDRHRIVRLSRAVFPVLPLGVSFLFGRGWGFPATAHVVSPCRWGMGLH